MIEVVVDWSVFAAGGGGGLRYCQEIVPLMARHPDFHIQAHGVEGGVSAPAGVSQLERITPSGKWFPEGPLKRQLSRVRQGIETSYRRLRLRRLGNQTVFYSPYYTLAPEASVPTVMVVHDLISEKFGSEFGADFGQLRELKKRTIPEAKRWIAVSECTRRDLIECFAVDPDKVDTVFHGVNQDYFSVATPPTLALSIRERLGSDAPFLLYVGGRMHHKNFTGLVEAYATSSFRGDYPLVAVGLPWGPSEVALLQKHGLEKQVLNYPNARDEELRYFYQEASVFVYPSLYEGFGLPPLEAMAAGTPVAAARAGSIPEVVGNAAALFDPQDPSSMNQAIESLLDPTTAAAKVRAGQERVDLLTWEKAAEGTLAALRKVF